MMNAVYAVILIGLCAVVVEAFAPSFDSSRTRSNSNLNAVSRRDMMQFVSVTTLVTTFRAPPAFAERSLGTVTESYKRYVPRMEAGFAFLAKDLREMIDRNDINGVVAEITADKGTTISAMKGTMKIFATAFSDSVLSQSTRELQLATLRTSDELDKIADGMRKGNRQKVDEAYKQALFFAQIYSETANGIIPRSLAKITGPTGVGARLPNDGTTF